MLNSFAISGINVFKKRFQVSYTVTFIPCMCRKKYAIIIPTVKRIQFFHAFKRIKYTICRSLDFSFVVFFL